MVNPSSAHLNVGSQLSDQRESGTLTLTHWVRQGLHYLYLSKRSNHLNIQYVSLSVCMYVCVFAQIVFMSTRCSLCMSLSQSIVYIWLVFMSTGLNATFLWTLFVTGDAHKLTSSSSYLNPLTALLSLPSSTSLPSAPLSSHLNFTWVP